jgi:hypothetical protein
LAVPLGTGLRKKIAEYIIGAFSIGAVDDGDIQMRQELAGVDVFNCGVIPGLDVSEEDVCEYRAREAKISFDAGNVINGDDGDENWGDFASFNCSSLMGTSPAAKSPTPREISSMPLTVPVLR